jgi:serine/threonine-protein kinase
MTISPEPPSRVRQRARWDELDRRLDQALDLAPDERPAFLRDACSGDPLLQLEVERLLAGCDEAGGFLESPALALAAPLLERQRPPTMAGARIGPYRVVRELARGGMGVVLLAERADGQFDQQAALKLIRRGFGSPELERRFRAERQLLARLSHPNIARLLDGGITDEGQPWCAMEYVGGPPLTAYCDERRLDVAARLKLFAEACEAVRYAHQNLVVHRDLKPSNVLVDASGHVRLLDFGIAKLLHDESNEAQTETSLHPMTPEYAAPEQVRREPITTATDVYSLGALLYELLAGRRVHIFERRTAAEIERVVCEMEPPAPRVSPDLDTIVLKALQKAPERRYPSVEALLDDLRRHEAGLPVRARPDSFRYRAAKFLRRHRVAAIAAAIVVLALVAGIAGTAWQARAARLEASRAQAVTDFVIRLFEISYPEQSRGREVTARELLDEGARRVEAELAGQPAVQATLLHVLGAVYRGLGELPKADTLLRRATEVSRAAFGAGHFEVANRAQGWGNVLFQRGQYREAAPVFTAALPINEETKRRHHPASAGLLFNLSHVKRRLGEYAVAESLLHRSLAINRRYYGDHHPAVAFDLNALGALLRGAGKLSAAESVLVAAQASQLRLFDRDHNDVLLSTHNLAAVRGELGRTAEAEALFRDVLERRRKKFPGGHPHLAATLHDLAGLLEGTGRASEAETLYVEAAALRRRMLGEEHDDVLRTRSRLAALRGRAGRAPDAASEVRAFATAVGARFGRDHPITAEFLQLLGDLLRSTGRCDEAQPVLQTALAIRRQRLDPASALVAETERAIAACSGPV